MTTHLNIARILMQLSEEEVADFLQTSVFELKNIEMGLKPVTDKQAEDLAALYAVKKEDITSGRLVVPRRHSYKNGIDLKAVALQRTMI